MIKIKEEGILIKAEAVEFTGKEGKPVSYGKLAFMLGEDQELMEFITTKEKAIALQPKRGEVLKMEIEIYGDFKTNQAKCRVHVN